jgi:phage terminase large subunit
LLIQASQRPLRVLCTREIQKSIKDSVHRLLSDQIQASGLESFFEVLETEIRGKNGSIFLFAGLLQHTIDSIKSFEGVDRVWVEEAHSVSKKSWSVLIPTIRKPGSEIWATFNPQLDSDPVYEQFVVQERDDCISLKVNWSDNPWFPRVLEDERQHAKRTLESSGRICGVPYDPLLKTHCIWDLGWNDSMSIILVQRSAGAEIRVIEYIEDSHRTLADYVADLKEKRYQGQRINWGTDFLPHDGFTKEFRTGKSAEEILISLGRSVQQTPRMDVESGIRAARTIFPRLYLDKEKTQRLVECLKRYRRHISQATNEPGQPLHDEYSHGADAFRYLALCSELLTNEEWGGALRYPKLNNA